MKRISLFFLVLLAATVVAPLLSSVSAQAVPDVKFADAWFGDIANKVEVAPGDEGVQLVVQLVNTEQKPFRYAEGILHLPEGFRDAVTGDRDTRPSVVQQIPSGGYFYFKFLVDIDKSVEVGVHKAVLEVRYVEWGEDDVSQTFMNIEFRVPGKSAIDVEANPSELEPGKEQELTITLRNTGSADAASLEVQVEAGSPGLAILSGQGKHVIGNLKAGSSTNIPVKVLASRALADSTSAIKLVISYLNSYGIPVQEVQSISLRIKPLGGVGVVLDAYLENPVLEPAKTSTLKIVVTNRGSETAEDVNVAIGLAQLPNPPLTLLEGSTSVKLGDLAPGESKQLSLKVFVNRLASGRSYSIPVSLTYADEEGRHVSQTG
ncbi:MAG: COG1361 S-layer family protein, partial [Thaumarchaeota archaeon]|nr:COG1361 S-layer family protein [Nitrososphaerota archaeon]